MRSLLLSDNYKMAMSSIRASKVRSFLTTVGIIIGVVSVITTVSLGEGVKRQIAGQIVKFGSDVVAVYPGNLVSRDSKGNIKSVNLFSTFGNGSLSEDDLKSVQNTNHVAAVSPLSLVSGSPQTIDKKHSNAVVMATSENFPDIVNQNLQYGSYFNNMDIDSNNAVVGYRVALKLFGESAPIGKSVIIRGHEFVINGVFDKFGANPFQPTIDLNNVVFVPYKTVNKLNGPPFIFQIIAKLDQPTNASIVANSITNSLVHNHGGETDFTVLKQDETLAIVQKVVDLITSLVAAIAAISLLIGGIGIMNIMLASVSERRQEIGIRKAIGATNSQIRYQFLFEASVLSVIGAFIGLFISLLGNIALRIFTDLSPVITPTVVVISMGVAIIVGIVFGLAPAIRASLKDPIESLRNQ